ncbi:MAG: hypothetical protein IKQ86_04585 [Prevotella sp.]|nr:hypothetical protein [Prevotella sp.]
MTLRKIAILALALLLPLSIGAQKKKKRVVKKPVVIEEPQEDPRITNMREMTQQILIIDSIVVDKDQILPHLRLSSETGSLMTTRDFLGKSVSGYAFINEMGNKAYFSLPDNSLRQQLFTSDVLGNEWSSPQPLTGISEGISEASYPFMLTDGITFYFAGKGEESIGGYDIFLTRYDSRSGSFFKPENIGMPFNSEANDYLYAIDEFNHIGYFVSDRRQPEGKVCIYIFVPSESRKTYDSSIYTEQQIRDFADIISIADTWGNGSERKAALARLKSINNVKPSADRKASAQSVTIVINDALTHSSAKDFRSSKAANLYQNLTKAQGRLSMVETDLTKARDLFATATAADRQNLRQRILQMEKEQQQLYQLIHSLEKDIRKEEIKVIN